MSECIFCKIVAGEIPAKKIAESTNFIAFLDIAPNAPGHSLVVPKKHVTNFLDMPEHLGSEYIEFTQRVASAILLATKADGFNLDHNNGAAAGQLVFHAHFHIIPRKMGDDMDFNRHLSMSQEQLEIMRQQIIHHIK